MSFGALEIETAPPTRSIGYRKRGRHVFVSNEPLANRRLVPNCFGYLHPEFEAFKLFTGSFGGTRGCVTVGGQTPCDFAYEGFKRGRTISHEEVVDLNGHNYRGPYTELCP